MYTANAASHHDEPQPSTSRGLQTNKRPEHQEYQAHLANSYLPHQSSPYDSSHIAPDEAIIGVRIFHDVRSFFAANQEANVHELTPTVTASTTSRIVQLNTAETDERRQARLQQKRENAAAKKASETDERRQARLQQKRENAAAKRASETDERRQAHLQQLRKYAAANEEASIIVPPKTAETDSSEHAPRLCKKNAPSRLHCDHIPSQSVSTAGL